MELLVSQVDWRLCALVGYLVDSARQSATYVALSQCERSGLETVRLLCDRQMLSPRSILTSLDFGRVVETRHLIWYRSGSRPSTHAASFTLTACDQELDLVSHLLPQLLNPLKDCPKLDLERADCVLGQSFRPICRVELFGAHQEIDDLGVEPGSDGLESFRVRIDALEIFAPGNDVDNIVESGSQSFRGCLVAHGHLKIALSVRGVAGLWPDRRGYRYRCTHRDQHSDGAPGNGSCVWILLNEDINALSETVKSPNDLFEFLLNPALALCALQCSCASVFEEQCQWREGFSCSSADIATGAGRKRGSIGRSTNNNQDPLTFVLGERVVKDLYAFDPCARAAGCREFGCPRQTTRSIVSAKTFVRIHTDTQR